jgi:hypothetical protein
MPKTPTPEEMREMARAFHIELSDDREEGQDVHLVVLRKECGQCRRPAQFVSVAPDIHEFLCYSCACGEWGREWVDAALKMEEAIDREEARTGKMWRP